VATRRLNDDETHQDRHLHLPTGVFDVQQIKTQVQCLSILVLPALYGRGFVGIVVPVPD
jgi:hypothetical protein